MIRKKASSQKTRKGIKKTANYILKDKGCCLYEASFIHRPNIIKDDLVNRLSSEIDDDVNFYNNNRKQGSAQQVRTYHDIVSFHTNDDMNPQKALQIAKELYEKTHNLSNRKYLMAVHNDTDEMHVHIIWSVRDNNGKTYKQKDDYRIIEIECDKLEDKYDLEKPKNRKATSTNKNEIEPLPSTNERMLDVRGIVSNKKKMKDALKPYLDKASTPSDFINQITDNGFTIIHNGKTAFSIQYQDQIFKASELNLSYKTLKTKLGEDEAFEQTLTAKHKTVDFSDCTLTIKNDKPDYMNRINPNSVLAKKFKCEIYDNKVEYFYNSTKDKKAFEYHKDPAKVSFSDLSRQSAKAGLQRLMADTTPPDTFYVTGPDYFKKNIWLESQLMGLEEKGIKLEGYKPTPADLEELKRIQEQYASMNSKFTPTVQAQPAQEAIEAPAPSTPTVSMPAAPTPFKTVVEQPTASGSDEPKKQVEQDEIKSFKNDDEEFENGFDEVFIPSNDDEEFEMETIQPVIPTGKQNEVFKNDDEEFEAETLNTYKNDDEEFEKEVIPTEKQNEIYTPEIKSPEQQKQDFDDLVDELIENYGDEFYPSYILSCVMDAVDGKINEDGYEEMNELHQRVFAHVEHFDEETKEEIKANIDEQIDLAKQEEQEEEMQNKRNLNLMKYQPQ
ncbi:TPA: relaxase/mobilization nuclease domain-containing protein [Pseudomonas aeruginosa]|nr:relaxase/mobilization nuclease domain-containing protein [Pseudomonas aeruginosa]HEJ2774750.1 relaxase/mobilization nuclease domain-containing protein [Pseudomonas aeruginosa]